LRRYLEDCLSREKLMFWGFVLLAAYVVCATIAVKAESKAVSTGALVAWGLLALAVGHFAWGVFGGVL